jgi:TPR repeat protein
MDEISRRALTIASDEAREAPARANPSDAAVLENVFHWFVQHGVAWSGTPGELAGIVGCPSEQVVHAMEVASVTLLVFGIAGSVCKRPGLPTVIYLRRLEEICNQCEFSKGPADPSLAQNVTVRDFNDAQPALENVVENTSQVQREDSESSASPGEPLDPEWRNKLAMGALTPVHDPADAQRGKFLWKALVVLSLLFAVAMTNRSITSHTIRIGSRFNSLVLRPVRETPREIPGNGAPRSDSRTTSQEASSSSSGEISVLYQQAKANDAAAQYMLGLRLLHGEGLQRNEAEAVTWFRQAAQSGNPSAEFELGMAYILGRGVRQDSVEGYTWLTLASKNGDTQAEESIRELTPQLSSSGMARVRWNLAEMYRQGIGTGMDKTTAYVWYVLAEAAGEKHCTKGKVDLARSMSEEQVAEATANALRWLRRHRM